ncbi:MAG: hypothetical protein MJB57_13685 [Gemmatimonadetes bacterium]|nr:hypothetical protein [Gemmatimonadota bacterium]
MMVGLDRTLGVLPMGYSLRTGLLTYAGVPSDLAVPAATLGLGLVLAGIALRWGRVSRR